ncbi:MAG: hypothetical protein U0228_22385 [Myxococcaceae bacterium]
MNRVMSSMTRWSVVVGLVVSVAAFAAPPGGPGPGPGAGEGKGPKWAENREERQENHEQKMRLMYLVAISEALNLSDADALKLSDKLKAIEDKRKPLRQQMGEAMKSLRDAADGDQAALTQVDANVQKVLDGRAQMAAMDKEMFNSLAQGYAPQQRAKLALVLARLGHEMKGGGMGKKGRFAR